MNMQLNQQEILAGITLHASKIKTVLELSTIEGNGDDESTCTCSIDRILTVNGVTITVMNKVNLWIDSCDSIQCDAIDNNIDLLNVHIDGADLMEDGQVIDTISFCEDSSFKEAILASEMTSFTENDVNNLLNQVLPYQSPKRVVLAA